MTRMKARMWRHIGAAVGVSVALTMLALAMPEHRVSMLNVFVAFVILAVSLDLMIGDVFMLAMGHAAFFGAGAYSSVLLHQEWGWPLPLGGIAGIALVAVLAVIIGLPATSRTAGLYFAIVTFAFGELLIQVVNNTTEISGGSEGLPVKWGLGSAMPFGWSIFRYFSFWLIGALLLTLVVTAVVRNSHFGLRLNAIRESENLTRGLGFNPTWYKTGIFVVGSCLAGIAGVLYAPMSGFINPDLMGVHESIYILGLLVVGGMRSVSGAFVGVFLLATVPQFLELDPVTRPMVVGLGMVFVMLSAPRSGIAGWIRQMPAVARRVGRFLGDRRSVPA